MSWNLCTRSNLLRCGVSLFVRLWVEIEPKILTLKSCIVSLFVRLWVEMTIRIPFPVLSNRSASSWGCELKYICLIHISWTVPVSLFVRLWVEINMPQYIHDGSQSASSWGCELKLISVNHVPPFFQSASSWGCELKYSLPEMQVLNNRQPLREAVSWNLVAPLTLIEPFSSASSWGCELK